MKICVVDDEFAVRSGVIHKLNGLNKPMEVFDAEFGLAALEKIREIRPHIVFTDILMPELNGLELLQKLKEELPSIRVFLLTGYSEFEYARKAIELGALGYLLKPADRSELLQAVENVRQEALNRLESDFRRYAQQLREWDVHLETGELHKPFDWYDNAVPKRIRLAAEPQCLSMETERIILTFTYKLHIYGAVVQADWKEPDCFMQGEQFITACLQETERWETRQFFGTPDGAGRRGGEAQLKQAAPMRQAVVQAVKELNVPAVEAQLADFLQHIGRLELKQLRKESAYLMAALEETLTAGHDIAIVEDDKLAYWTSWVKAHPTWQELRSRMERFIAGGAKALSELDSSQQPTDLVDKAMQFVNRCKGSDINLESVASALSVHSVTLSRMFKQQTGENFVRYAVRHKMMQAERLLRESEKKVGEIAEVTGYTDYRYFSQLFKQAYGLSPSEYRKRHARTER